MWKGRGSTRKLVTKKDEMYYVPLLKTLERLLQNEAIVAEVCWCHVIRKSSIMYTTLSRLSVDTRPMMAP